jgi:hypothetical protein
MGPMERGGDDDEIGRGRQHDSSYALLSMMTHEQDLTTSFDRSSMESSPAQVSLDKKKIPSLSVSYIV